MALYKQKIAIILVSWVHWQKVWFRHHPISSKPMDFGTFSSKVVTVLKIAIDNGKKLVKFM